MGWLLVAFLVSRSGAVRLERGGLSLQEWATTLWPALPGFAIEFLADWSLHDFRLHNRPGSLVAFAIFSTLFLILIVAATAALNFGIRIGELSSTEEEKARRMVSAMAIAVSICVTMGSGFVLTVHKADSVGQATLQSWLFGASLMVYIVLTMKMFPSLVVRPQTL